MWLILLVSCARGPAQDVSRYAELLGLERPGVADMARCGELSDPDLAGDCALALAPRVASGQRVGMETLCERVPEGTWRDECWFQAAEAQRKHGHEQEAAELCRRAGPFINDCAQHLWQTRVHALISSRNGAPPDFFGKLATAQKIYDEWSPYLADSSDLEQRFWTKYFQNGFETVGRVDLAWCSPLPEPRATQCVNAAKDLLTREMAPNLDRNSAWSAFCALKDPTSSDVSFWFRLVPSPPLDALVQERHAVLCKP